MRKLIALCLLAQALWACQPTVQPIINNNPTNPTGPNGPTPPNYNVNGYVATEDDTYVIDAVLEMDSNGITQNYYANVPRDFQAIFNPSTGTLSVYFDGQAYDGTWDAESGTFTASNGYGSGAPNFVRFFNGLWTYIADGQVDQNDGRFRHTFAYASGPRWQLPTSGSANYDSAILQGTIESYTASSYNSTPYSANGSMSANFQNLTVYGSFQLDGSNSAYGQVVMTGNALNSDGTFVNNGYANLSVGGTAVNANGYFAGFIAGPNQEEIGGVINMTDVGGTANHGVTGSFLGQDTNRFP